MKKIDWFLLSIVTVLLSICVKVLLIGFVYPAFFEYLVWLLLILSVIFAGVGILKKENT